MTTLIAFVISEICSLTSHYLHLCSVTIRSGPLIYTYLLLTKILYLLLIRFLVKIKCIMIIQLLMYFITFLQYIFTACNYVFVN
jgi:hypothetical protein